MSLQNSTEAAIPEPSAEVLATLRRRVQQACDHPELRLVTGDEERTECINCGYRVSTVRRALRAVR
ncbi:MAG TPA: hypothetical protein VFB07_09740 [Vicinamibacterales bacterium]|nr:hypothetical protein [Vicinamibacterales bacterium]